MGGGDNVYPNRVSLNNVEDQYLYSEIPNQTLGKRFLSKYVNFSLPRSLILKDFALSDSTE